jgi:hypothetical protein
MVSRKETCPRGIGPKMLSSRQARVCSPFSKVGPFGSIDSEGKPCRNDKKQLPGGSPEWANWGQSTISYPFPAAGGVQRMAFRIIWAMPFF